MPSVGVLHKILAVVSAHGGAQVHLLHPGNEGSGGKAILRMGRQLTTLHKSEHALRLNCQVSTTFM